MQHNIHISIITVFPQLHDTWASTSLLKRAQESGQLSLSTVRLSDMVPPKERIDVPTCGPGPGMVLRAEVVSAAIDKVQAEHGKGTVVFFSPSGTLLTQRTAEQFVTCITQEEGSKQLSDQKDSSLHLILVCARYEGVDCRVEQEYANAVFSIGNFVLMGGDVPAQIFTEAILRFFPGILGNTDSLADDSFQGPLVDYPAYGQPKEWRGRLVPDILLSGDHAKITAWRQSEALKQTLLHHFQWLRTSQMPTQLRDQVAQEMPPHYVILMHDQVLIGKKMILSREGVTSVTTIDLHDIARSCATYNIQKFFIVTPLHDQQRLLEVFFQFWQSAQGKQYNISRYDAMSRVRVVGSIQEAEAVIEQECDGQKPLRIATSAKHFANVPALDYHEQEHVWPQQKPISLIFGTGQGLTNDFLQSCDFLLVPIRGFTNYNHLSVRSAVAIILDRWLAWRKPK